MAQYQFQVDVVPQYLPEQSAPEQGIYSFAYAITVTNTGTVAARLVARHWFFADAAGHVEEVKGLGVVGEQPLLQPGAVHRYTSGCRLRTPSGSMRGSFFCVAEDGERFDVAIAPCMLDDGSARVLH